MHLQTQKFVCKNKSYTTLRFVHYTMCWAQTGCCDTTCNRKLSYKIKVTAQLAVLLELFIMELCHCSLVEEKGLACETNAIVNEIL